MIELALMRSWIRIKAVDIPGVIEVELSSDGSLYRVTANLGRFNKTRVFSDYSEASAMFDSYLSGD